MLAARPQLTTATTTMTRVALQTGAEALRAAGRYVGCDWCRIGYESTECVISGFGEKRSNARLP